MTNDGWFLRSAGSQQHLANAVFRCVETRLPMVRAANTGVTCFINEFGRITHMLVDETGSQFTEGVLTGAGQRPDRPPADLLRATWRAVRARVCWRIRCSSSSSLERGGSVDGEIANKAVTPSP